MYREIRKSFERMQKVVAVALCVVLAGSFYSCGKRVEAGGEVPFKACPCDEDKSMQLADWGDTPVEFYLEGYLFKDFRPENLILEPFVKHEDPLLTHAYYIVYDSEKDMACYSVEGGIPGTGSPLRICNFPYFAKEWNIPENGLKISFSGVFYFSCERKAYMECCGSGDWSSQGGFYFAYDIILTNLKRRK